MSESSQDKTRREYIRNLLSYPWSYQTSIYFTVEGSQFLLEEMKKIKPKIRYHYRTHPFLLRVAIMQKGTKRTARVSILSLSKILGFDEKLKSWLSPEHIEGVQTRAITEHKLMSTATTIKTKAPHDLRHFFGKTKVNRISLLNGDNLTEPSTEKYLSFLNCLNGAKN